MSTRDELFQEQLAYREYLREEERKEQQEQELIQAVAANLPAYDASDNWRGGAELGEEVILARVDEFQQKAAVAAAKAEEFAQSALMAESRGDMGVASILWGDSWSYDQKAKNYGAEAARYEQMGQPPGTVPKPKSTSPGAMQSQTEATAPTVTAEETDRAEAEAAENAETKAWQEYLRKSAEQVIKGKFSDDVTALGTAAEIGLAFTPLDVAQDARDLAYDLTHLKTTPWYETALDALAIVPVLGAVKPIAKAIEAGVDASRTAGRVGEAAAHVIGTAGKHGDELVDAGGDLVYNGAKQLDGIDLKPADLMEELAASGKKYTPENVLMVTKNSNGDLLWLETGNESAGLTHILQRHEGNFEDCGIVAEEVPKMLSEVLKTEPVKTINNKSGPCSIYTYNGQDYLVAYGDNGYIVSFYPYTVK